MPHLTNARRRTAVCEGAANRNGVQQWPISPPRGPKIDPFFRRKYPLDRLLGSVLLVLSAPLTLTLFALVKLTSRGPGFYRQKRVGLNGRTFEIIKLRSMYRNAERPGEAVWCTKGDCRITPLGRILRKFHLDELPQLVNVVRGEMCLVGPRPERPQICKKLAERIDDYYDRVSVKPGVTGLAQLNLPPDETVDDARRKQILDLRYIQEAGPWLEFRILMATFMRMFGISSGIVMNTMRLGRLHLLPDDADLSELEAAFREPEPEPKSKPKKHRADAATDFTFNLEDSDSGVLL